MPYYPPASSGTGNVAADAIWDAAGDLAVGSGADTAAKLTKGSAGQMLLANATTLAWTTPGIFGTLPSGALVENLPRTLHGWTGSAQTTNVMKVNAIWLPAGIAITKIGIMCGSTAESGGSHAWAALYDSSKALLRQSTDETGSAAITASVIHEFALSSFTTTYSGLHYIGICVVATTMPSLMVIQTGNALMNGIAPILVGNTNDATPTATAPNPFGTITAGASLTYCYVA